MALEFDSVHSTHRERGDRAQILDKPRDQEENMVTEQQPLSTGPQPLPMHCAGARVADGRTVKGT